MFNQQQKKVVIIWKAPDGFIKNQEDVLIEKADTWRKKVIYVWATQTPDLTYNEKWNLEVN